MSRSDYSDDLDNWAHIRWRGRVSSAIRGKRGQAFLREMLEALDGMTEKRLIANSLKVEEVNPILPWLFADTYRSGPPIISFPRECGVCALGALGEKRGVALDGLDPEDYEAVASTFGIASPLAQEVVWLNDEAYWRATPPQRWQHVRDWVASNIKEPHLPKGQPDDR